MADSSTPHRGEFPSSLIDGHFNIVRGGNHSEVTKPKYYYLRGLYFDATNENGEFSSLLVKSTQYNVNTAEYMGTYSFTIHLHFMLTSATSFNEPFCTFFKITDELGS